MKQRLQKMIGVIVTMCLIAIFVTVPGHLLRPIDCDICVDAIETFHKVPEDSLDVIGFGSSHMWRSLNAMEMYENYGIEAYNYGCNWQHLNTTLLFMQDAFRTQSPKVVLVECFRVNELLINVDLEGEIYYTSKLPATEERQEYLKQCFGNDIERYLSYYLPIYGFHDNWSNIGRPSFMESSSTYDFTKTRGYVDTIGQVPITLGDASTFVQNPLSGEAVALLDKMVALCEENGAKLIFYVTPYQGEWGYRDAMKTYAKEKECVFFDFFELAGEVGIDANTDFEDPGHTNTTGANKITNYLSKYIVENYEFVLVEKSE